MQEADRELLVARLIEWGYTDPIYAADEISDEQLEMDLSDYQEFHEVPLSDLCQTTHGRALMIDGDMGPATRALMDSRTCGVKDPAGRFARREEANWPAPCRDDISISWNFKSAPGLTQTETNEIWNAVHDEYGQRFELFMPLRPQDYPRTRIYAALKALPGSTLAWSYLANNNCSARLRQAYDNTIRWSVPLALGTFKHEVGHALGMEHTPGDRNSLMYPSMNSQTKLNQTDIDQMVRIGYKLREDEPVDPVDPDPDEPDGPVKVLVVVGGKTYRHAWNEGESLDNPNLNPL